MAKLVLLHNGCKLDEVQFSGEKICIGRSDINHIHLDDQTVSRFHAEILRQGFIFTLNDKRSTNGTLLNNFPVRQRQLNDYDEIRIGSYQLVFILDKVDEPKTITRYSVDPSATLLELPAER